jgi:protease IV
VIKEGGEDKVLVLTIDGVITDETETSFLGIPGESMVSGFKKQLMKAEKDSFVKGVILRINSPGGAVTTSDILYKEILDFKAKKQVPVISLFMDITASGGYYIAMATDYIIAHPTTLTGSIGVIIGGFNFKDGMDKIGVKYLPVTSGKNKAILSPFMESTPEQRDLIQSIVDETFESFYTKVKENRKGTDAKLRPICDGRVFTAAQAQSHGLVDKIGYFEDSIQYIQSLKNFSKSDAAASPKVILYSKKKKNVKSIYDASIFEPQYIKLIKNINNLAPTGGKLMYLWPGF